MRRNVWIGNQRLRRKEVDELIRELKELWIYLKELDRDGWKRLLWDVKIPLFCLIVNFILCVLITIKG